MNKINWKVRFKNPVFVLQVGLSILMPILTYFGLTLDQLVTWEILFNVLFEALKNPFVLGTIGVSLWNALNDPTTTGIVTDSSRSLKYNRPNGDK